MLTHGAQAGDSPSSPAGRTYQVRTYGCQMNVHDSERLAGLLEAAGYRRAADGADAASTLYDYEPSEEGILADLLPRGVATQIFTALLENGASEQGARMTAMDNATRNAGEMIDRLTIEYNRSRQAAITKELIEIISGAEAL